ncbi:hypothetical protein Ancab_003892, partial [Ancistrocladus abbreviatus]
VRFMLQWVLFLVTVELGSIVVIAGLCNAGGVDRTPVEARSCVLFGALQWLESVYGECGSSSCSFVFVWVVQVLVKCDLI